MSEMQDLVKLSRIMVERYGQRLYATRGSPAIFKIRSGVGPLAGELWIKEFHGRFNITLSLLNDNARTCVYDDQPGEETVVAEWGDWLMPFLTDRRRFLPLEALADA